LPSTERGSFCRISTDSSGERVLYCNGTNVLWRPIAPLAEGKCNEKPEDIFVWKGHTKRTTCASMTANKEWVVSGDDSGAIRVWGAKGDHVQKNEYKLWSGAVKDVAWSSDSTRIVAAGDGNDVRAVAMIWDTGSKTGEVTGHTKAVNSIAFRSQRPFRVMTGGQDFQVAFHEGPPFKFARSYTEHTNFVNSVRYSPDGEWAVSAGSDSKVCLYKGKEGEFVKEFAKPAGITGSLWDVAWAPDSTRVATAGGDKRIRIWDRDSGAQVAEAPCGAGALEDMQVGLTWPTADRIISVCLDGRLMFWNVGADSTLTLSSVVSGTQGSITCLARDGKTGTLLHGSGDGTVALTPTEKPPSRMKVGKGVQHILTHSAAYDGPSEAWVIALDDNARRISVETGEVVGEAVAVKEFSVGARWLDAEETKILIASGKNSFHCITKDGIAWSRTAAVPRRPTALAVAPGKGRIAVGLEKPEGSVGGVESNQFLIQLFGVEDNSKAEGVVELASLEGHRSEVTALSFSPSGELLASGDTSKSILVWNMTVDPVCVLTNKLCSHTARVNSLDWLPSGRQLLSASLDQKLFVWDVDKPDKAVVTVTEAHKAGVTGAVVCGDKGFASVGADGFLQVYKMD